MNDGLEWMRNDVTVASLRYYPGICVDGLRKNMETVRTANDLAKI